MINLCNGDCQYARELRNIKSTDPHAELTRVRGLLQRQFFAFPDWSHLTRDEKAIASGAFYQGIDAIKKALSQGAESADIGKLDTADKSGKVNGVEEAPSGSAAYHQEHIEMQRRIKNQRQQLAKAYKDLEEKNRRIEYLEPFRQQVQGITGSAETGGEKAAPVVCLTCYPQGGFHHIDCPNQPGGAYNNRFVDWPLGPESREPEKLNNAQKCAQVGCGHDQWRHDWEGCDFPDCQCTRFKSVALAESSLSSPPPIVCVNCGHENDCHAAMHCYCKLGGNILICIRMTPAASPELLPTQPDSSEESPLELLLHCAEEVVHCGKCEDCKKMSQAAIQQARKETRNE